MNVKCEKCKKEKELKFLGYFWRTCDWLCSCGHKNRDSVRKELEADPNE